MNERQFKALLGVEIRRGLPPTLRYMGLTPVIGMLFVFVGSASRENIGVLLLGFALGYIFTVPMAAMKDRIDGSMEFVSTLPASGEALAAPKFLAAALSVLPGAIQVAAAAGWWVFPALGFEEYGRMVTLVFFGSWLAMSGVACLMVALFVRFEVRQVMTGPMVVGGVLMATLFFLDRVASPSIQTVRAFVEHPWAPFIVAAFAFLGIAAIFATALVLAKKGFEDYRPLADSITW